MFQKKITYTDYDGVERTETFYFNISRAELTELQLTYPGGYGEYIERVVDSNDQAQVMKLFKDFIMRSYGEKSADGKRFVKSPELAEAFLQTPAYDELFMEMAGDVNAALDFVAGAMPDFGKADEKRELVEKTRKRIEEQSLAAATD